MAEWFLWIKDRRQKPLPRAEMLLRMKDALLEQGISLVCAPYVVLPTGKRQGEWCLRVAFDPVASPENRAKVVCNRFNYEIRVCQPAPPRRHLRSVRTTKSA